MKTRVIVMTDTGPVRGILTTDHARSNYGQPVLLIRGVPHGPGDITHTDIRLDPPPRSLPIRSDESAWNWCCRVMDAPLTPAQQLLVMWRSLAHAIGTLPDPDAQGEEDFRY